MLNEHTLDQLKSLRLDGMVRAIEEQSSSTAISTAASGLSFDERLTLLVQREIDWRDGKRLARLLKAAKLKVSSACIEDIDWRGGRAFSLVYNVDDHAHEDLIEQVGLRYLHDNALNPFKYPSVLQMELEVIGIDRKSVV